MIFTESTKKYEYTDSFKQLEDNVIIKSIRSRIHTQHTFSGFGKSFEQTF